jgi:branched-subunit amino acid aminotransferase/4-amino-4-deoxychorismate lyase
MTASLHSINGCLWHEGGIPPEDRAFRLGDGLFETCRVINRTLWQGDYHWQRLAIGCQALGIPEDIAQWQGWVDGVLQREDTPTHGWLRMSLSRGSGSRGYSPAIQDGPRLVLSFTPYSSPFSPPTALRLWLSQWRKPSADVLPGHLKHASALNSILAVQEATSHGADDALQLTMSGDVAELASANLYWQGEDGAYYTPSSSCNILPGSVRHWLLQQQGILWQQGAYPLESLRQASHVWASNIRLGIVPVVALEPMGWQWSEAPADHPLRQFNTQLQHTWGSHA